MLRSAPCQRLNLPEATTTDRIDPGGDMARRGFAAGGLIALVAVSAALARIPETPMFRQIGPEAGLPSNQVNALAQDRAGYLWVATSDGLARFDGVGFRVWQHDPSDPASLPGNVVQALHIDAADRVWVGTEGGGLSRLQAGNGGFRHYARASDARFALDDVWSIASTPDGALWFGGFGAGLYRFDPARDVVRAYRHDPAQATSLVSDHILTLRTDAAGALWIGTATGLDRVDPAQPEAGFEHVAGVSGALVVGIEPTPQGQLYIGSAAGLDRRDQDGVVAATPDQAVLEGTRVSDLALDARGTLWVGTTAGVRVFEQARLSRIPDRGGRRHAIGNSPIKDILEDREGGLWFATLGSGLRHLPPNWRDFAVLMADNPERGGLGSTALRGVASARSGGLWSVGVGTTFDRIDERGSVTRHPRAPTVLPDRRSWSVLEDAQGIVWIGQQDGLVRYDPARGALQSWRRDSAVDAVPAGPVDLLALAPDGSVWLSALGAGVQQRAPDGRVLANHAGAAAGLDAADTEQLEFAPDGRLWLAGASGLLRFDPARQRFAPVPGAPTARVFAFAFGPDGLWTQRLGALEHFRYEGEGMQRVARIGVEQGLPAVEAGGLRVGANGEVWISTTRGLFRYRPAHAQWRRYGVRDGLPSQEFINRPMLALPDGSLAAGTLEGLVWFDPARLHDAPAVPRLHLEGAQVRRAGALLALEAGAPLQLRHDDRDLRLRARLLSFTDPQSHRYRFRLRGYEPGWIDAGANGERAYSQLPPGDYRFEAVAANADGVWSAPPLTLAIRVAPPWWDTVWARALFALAALLILVVVAAWYRRRLKDRHATQLAQRQHEWTQRASEAKSSFLATLGHEIRTPMTGVLGMTELLLRTPLNDRQRDYADSIRRSGDLLLRLVNDALDLARIEAGKLELEDAPVDLAGLLRDVADLQRPVAESRGLAYRVSVDADAPRWVRGDALRLQQILLNLGGNAIKFTERGEVMLALQADVAPATLCLMVSDTGPGLDAEQRSRLFRRFSQADGIRTARQYGGSGLGLAICQELASAMQGRIDVDSEPGRGTTFRVRLPLPICAAPETMRATDDSTAAALPARRLLLVEDDATVAAVVAGLLHAQGHVVHHAPHGLAALAELARQSYDLAFVDLDLPGVSGLDLARLIVAQVGAPVLVALTARADSEAESQAHAAGMQGFLRKPVSGVQLAEVLSRHLSTPG
jgi:signal transduction histidine kinase/CheY-like chemotaxis protein/sugar lactone lactonase YvrE